MSAKHVIIPAGAVRLDGDLAVPDGASGLIVFVHGSGSSRLSPRNRSVAAFLRETGRFGTLLFDLLSEAEDSDYPTRFDIRLLAERLDLATVWIRTQPGLETMPIGYFGASTGAAAALVTASVRNDVSAIVSRGGRPDLAGDALPRVTAPTLLIVGGEDTEVIGMNRDAAARMTAPVEIEIVPGARHLFEEPGALDEVARITRAWFEEQMPGA
jgi:putative phosphoribosyl transferase